MKIAKNIVLAMSATCLALMCGCSDGEKAQKKQTVTIQVKVPTIAMASVTNPEITDAYTFLEEAGEAFAAQYTAADVTVDVKSFDYVDEQQAITGSFDTDHATDVLFEDYFNMAAYVYTGRVVPLDDVMTDEIVSDLSAESVEMSTVGGKLYMAPYLSRQNILIYRKSLMAEYGLESYVSDGGEIQNWTTDEWTQILDTLAENLPENVYPMMMYGKNNQGDTHIMSFIRAFGSEIFDSDGNFDFESPESVQALEWIADGVSRGWYPPHPENLEITDAQELFNNGQLVFYVYNNANSVLYDSLDDFGFVNFPGGVATSFVTGFEVFDNGDDAVTEVSKAFVKYIYETDEWLEVSAGNIPASQRVARKYAESIENLAEFTANSAHVVDFMNNSPNWQGTDDSVRSVFYQSIHKLLLGKITAADCAAELDSNCNNALEIGRKSAVLHE